MASVSNVVQPGTVSPSSAGGGFWNSLGQVAGTVGGWLNNGATALDNGIGSAIQGFASTAPNTGFSNTQNSQSSTAPAPNLSTGINTSSYVPPPVSGYVSPSNAGGGTTSGGTPGGSTGSSINTYGLNTSSPNWYQLQPGESTSNYYARTQGQTQTQALAQTAPATGGTSAPTSSQAAANTYSGGVNSSGQTLPGYVPVPQVNTPNNPNTATGSTFNNDVGTESQIAATSSPQYQQAYDDYMAQEASLSQIQAQAGQQNVNILGGRTNLQEAGGMQGLLGLQTSAAETPLTQRMQADTAAMAAATGQQGTQQSGLQGAAGLVNPATPANALGTFNPATGATTGYAQGAGSTAGGAATAGAVGSQMQQGATVQTLTGTLNQANTLAGTLSGVINSAGYNPNNLGVASSFANGVNQWLQNQSGSPQYQNAANLIGEIASKYANILQQSGGTPTSVTQIQSQIINGLASGQNIETMISNLAQNAQESINALGASSQNNAVTNPLSGSIFGNS